MMISTVTLCEFFEEYYWPTCCVGCADATRREYETALKHWRQITGDPPLAQISNKTVAAFYEELLRRPGRLGKTMSPNTVRKYARHVQPILDTAGPPSAKRRDGHGLISVVPFARPPRVLHTTKRRLTLDEIDAMCRVCDIATLPDAGRSGLEPHIWWQTFLVTAYNTGLRRGAILGIEMANIAWRERYIRIVPTTNRNRREQIVPINDVLLAYLLRASGKRRQLLAWHHAPSAFTKQWHKIRKAADVEYLPFNCAHSERRTHGTELARKSLAAAQLSLGHASTNTTCRHYLGQELVASAVAELPQPAAFLELMPAADEQLRLFE